MVASGKAIATVMAPERPWQDFDLGQQSSRLQQNRMGDSTWSGGQASADTQASKSNSWSGGSVDQGEWFWTPQCWVWGRDLDSAIQDYIAKKWVTVDEDFAQWWATMGDDSASRVGDGSGQGVGEGGRPCSSGRSGQSNVGSYGAKGTGNDGRPNRGKDHVPSHDGSLSMREYERRVRLFQQTTAIDLEYQAGKLIERLQGPAWDCLHIEHADGLWQGRRGCAPEVPVARTGTIGVSSSDDYVIILFQNLQAVPEKTAVYNLR